MQRLKTFANGAIVALFICGGAACGDDSKSQPENPDGSHATGAGDASASGTHDGGGAGMDAALGDHLDGAIVDGAVVVAPDGAIIGTVLHDGGTTTLPQGPDSGTSAGACASSCNDNIDCTVDLCVDGKCTHRVDDSVCTAGSSCTLTAGCQQGKTCANAMDCADTDGCTTNERCDTGLARCLHDVLDSDGDGYAPIACMGADCNDARGLDSPGGTEVCDGLDNNCNSVVDDGATCRVGQKCVAGACACETGLTQCGGPANGGCFDLKTTAAHCGACGTDCGSGVCTNGACSCPAPATVCTTGMGMAMTASCVDVKTSDIDCGGCGMACPLLTMGQFNSCLQGACTPCGAENQACCAGAMREGGNNGCLTDLTCSGTPGAAGSKCVCGAGDVKCDGQCTNLRTSRLNCGMCGKACMGAERCLPKGESAACVACGTVGAPCCDNKTCIGGGTVCGPNDTCVRRMVQSMPANPNPPGN